MIVFLIKNELERKFFRAMKKRDKKSSILAFALEISNFGQAYNNSVSLIKINQTTRTQLLEIYNQKLRKNLNELRQASSASNSNTVFPHEDKINFIQYLEGLPTEKLIKLIDKIRREL